ncbi:hypothetical protein V501_05072 [Pseudogymnoascus sp. VKM F-4519 (FW-2642)]|nr:hypothetical protein V501_05072 [Pseudogymnoascus sp. VKM F-4519 (FW-2642)]
MTIAAPPRVRTSNLKSQAQSEAPGFTHLFLLLQGCLASTVQPTLAGAAVSRPKSKGLLVYGLPGLPESHPHHLSIVDLPLEDVDVPSGMASSSWATKEGQSLSTMGQLPLAVIFTRARAAAMAELQVLSSFILANTEVDSDQLKPAGSFNTQADKDIFAHRRGRCGTASSGSRMELVPADPDISRMYEVQELDGNWTRRSRYTIDSKDIGQTVKYFTTFKTGYTQWWLFQFGFSSMLSLSFHFLMFGVLLEVQVWSEGCTTKVMLVGRCGLLWSYHDGDGSELHGKGQYSSRMATQLLEMLLLGLTGSIATGKSTVSNILRAPPYSIPIIDADVIAREVVEPGTSAYDKIVGYFGATTPDLLLPKTDDGKGRPLNRPALGRRVFGDTDERKKDRAVLNGIVHPAVRMEMYRQLLRCYLRGCWAVVLDVPLLFESGLDTLCGTVMVVAVGDPAIQMRRLRDRDAHLTAEDAENRVLSQGDIREKAKRCEARGDGRGVVVWNDGGREELKKEIERVMSTIMKGSPKWWAWLLLLVPPLAGWAGLWTYYRNMKVNKDWRQAELESKAKL